MLLVVPANLQGFGPPAVWLQTSLLNTTVQCNLFPLNAVRVETPMAPRCKVQGGVFSSPLGTVLENWLCPLPFPPKKNLELKMVRFGALWVLFFNNNEFSVLG